MGYNAILYAVQRHSSTNVDALVRCGADIDGNLLAPETHDVAMPLQAVLLDHDFRAAEILLKYGANINLKNPLGGKTYLHYAVIE